MKYVKTPVRRVLRFAFVGSIAAASLAMLGAPSNVNADEYGAWSNWESGSITWCDFNGETGLGASARDSLYDNKVFAQNQTGHCDMYVQAQTKPQYASVFDYSDNGQSVPVTTNDEIVEHRCRVIRGICIE